MAYGKRVMDVGEGKKGIVKAFRFTMDGMMSRH
jgi:hypothetical protein